MALLTPAAPPPAEAAAAEAPPAPARAARPWRPFALALAALLVAALLNAEELERTARRQPFGWRRTALVAVAGAVHDAADATGLTAPRRALERLVGDDDRAAAPAETGAAPATTPAAAARRAVTPEHPLRVALVGDSVMEAVGRSFAAAGESSGLVEATVESHLATGLSRPDYFDWPARLAEIRDEVRPDVFVVLVGAQDAQPMETASGVVHVGTPAWEAEYRARVAAAMDAAAAGGRPVFWLGQPAMRSEQLSARMRALNAIYRAEAARHPGVAYVDVWALTDGDDGGFASRLPDADGDLVTVRDDDGVHFVGAGGDLVARAVLDAIAAAWGADL